MKESTIVGSAYPATEGGKSVSVVSTVSEPVRPPSGPYWQMVYLAVSGFLFWAILMIQIPFIDKYFGGPKVIFYVTFVYGLAANLARVFLIWYATTTAHSAGKQMWNLILYGGIFTAVSMAAFPISMSILGTENGDIGFWICIFLAASVGGWNSCLMNAGFSLMSMAPEKSATFFLLGQTTTGVVTWPLIIVLRIAVKALGAEEQTDYVVAVISLSLAAAVCIGVIPLYHYKTRHHVVFAHLLQAPPASTPKTTTNVAMMKKIFRAIAAPAISCWLSGVFTFAVFPSQIGLWFPSGDYEVSLYRSFVIYIFSIADTIGRAVPRFVPAIQAVSDRVLYMGTVGRGTVFIPIFLLSSKCLPAGLGEDWVRLVVVIVFGLSNGVNFAIGNVIGPKRVQAADKMNAGTILSFMAINGLFIGSLVGIGFKHI